MLVAWHLKVFQKERRKEGREGGKERMEKEKENLQSHTLLAGDII